ncbi:MAG TPA: ABC transporter ATP-binding protein [Pirellulales bacterium]
MERGALIVAESLTMQFAGGTEALRAVTCSIKSGEFVSLVGPSGCGKSTLLRLTAGLLAPSAGRLTVAGQTPRQARDALRVSFVFQEATLLPWRSAARNVALPLELAGAPREARRQQAVAGLGRVGLGDFIDSRPRELSGGMRMRVSLARALVTQPQLLLLDEPFGALDDLTRQSLGEDLLGLWNDHHWTALFVTHNIAEAAFLSTRILVIGQRPGTVVADLTVPFAPNRSPELRAQADFARFVGDVAAQLRKERS